VAGSGKEGRGGGLGILGVEQRQCACLHIKMSCKPAKLVAKVSVETSQPFGEGCAQSSAFIQMACKAGGNCMLGDGRLKLRLEIIKRPRPAEKARGSDGRGTHRVDPTGHRPTCPAPLGSCGRAGSDWPCFSGLRTPGELDEAGGIV
jgi:hypothetical protein